MSDQAAAPAADAELLKLKARRELVRRLASVAAVPAVIAVVAGNPRPAKAY